MAAVVLCGLYVEDMVDVSESLSANSGFDAGPVGGRGERVKGRAGRDEQVVEVLSLFEGKLVGDKGQRKSHVAVRRLQPQVAAFEKEEEAHALVMVTRAAVRSRSRK